MQKNTKQLGRPKKPAHQKLEVRSIRFNSEQWAKIDAAGLEALRHLIDTWPGYENSDHLLKLSDCREI